MSSNIPTQKEIIESAIEQIASIFVALIDHKEIIKISNKTNDQEAK